jgi:hypothetical protein
LDGGYLHRWWWLHCRCCWRWLLRSDRRAERRKKSRSPVYASSLSFCLSRHISSCWSLLFSRVGVVGRWSDGTVWKLIRGD